MAVYEPGSSASFKFNYSNANRNIIQPLHYCPPQHYCPKNKIIPNIISGGTFTEIQPGQINKNKIANRPHSLPPHLMQKIRIPNGHQSFVPHFDRKKLNVAKIIPIQSHSFPSQIIRRNSNSIQLNKNENCYYYKSNDSSSCRSGSNCKWRHYNAIKQIEIKTRFNNLKYNKPKQQNIKELSKIKEIQCALETITTIMSSFEQEKDPNINYFTIGNISLQEIKKLKIVLQENM